jgi:hypothetical protein
MRIDPLPHAIAPSTGATPLYNHRMQDGLWKPPDYGRQIAEAVSRVPQNALRLLDQLTRDVTAIVAQIPDLDELDELEKRFLDLMILHDWPPPLGVSIADVRSLLRHYGRNPQMTTAEVDEWVMSLCSEDALRSVVDDWGSSPLCRRRMPPLKAAVEAHLNKQYFCSIPVILAQTEGLVCDYVGDETARNLTHAVRKKAEKSLAVGAEKRVNAYNRRALCRYYLEAVMASLAPDEALPGSLRRNLILHGGDCTYGTPAMSSKALMLFDTIVESLEVALIEGDDAFYHLPACSRCRAASNGAVAYVHISSPDELVDRTPCRLCGAPDLHVGDPLTNAAE